MVRDLYYLAQNSHIYLLSLGRVRAKFYGQKKILILANVGHFQVVIYQCENVSDSQKTIIWCPQTNVLQWYIYHLSSYAYVTHDCLRLILNQRFLMTTYFWMHSIPQSTFFNGVYTTYFLYEWTVLGAG